MVQKFVPRSVVGIFRNKRTCSSPLDSKLMCLVHFVQFWCIGDCLVDLPNSVQNGPNWCKSLCHEVASQFFATNAPNPPHWTLNSCFSVFRTILVYLGPFGCLTNLRAKRSRVGIFHNERTRSTALDPKLIYLVRFVLFRCIWDCSVALRNSVQN